MRQDGQRPNRVRLEVSDWSEGCLSKALKETLKDLCCCFEVCTFWLLLVWNWNVKFLNIEGLQVFSAFGDFQKARLCTCSWNRIRQGVGGFFYHVRMCTWHGFYTCLHSVFCHVASWAFTSSLSNFCQIPRNAIMCSTLLRAAPAVLPSKLKLASDLVTRRVEIWFLTDDDGILDGGVEPWVSCFFFCQKHKKRAEFREQTDLLFFLFLIQGAQCSGFHHFWRCGFLRGGHGKGSETWHHRIQCVSLDVFSWEGKAGKAIASMPRWGSHGFLWTWKQMADFNEIVEQGPRGRTWQ